MSPTPGNNSATDTDTIQAPAGATVTGTKTASGTFEVGGTVTPVRGRRRTTPATS